MDDFAMLIVASLATYRLARLLGHEDGPFFVLRRFRETVYILRGFEYVVNQRRWARKPKPPRTIAEGLEDDWIAEGVSCALCLSPYVGMGVFALVTTWPPYAPWILYPLAFAGAASVLKKMER